MFGEAGLISCPIMWFAISPPLLSLVSLEMCAPDESWGQGGCRNYRLHLEGFAGPLNGIMRDDACLQIHHHSQTVVSLPDTNSAHILLVHGRGNSLSLICTNIVTLQNTSNTGWRVVPGKSLCIINCRAGYKAGRMATMMIAARYLTAQPVTLYHKVSAAHPPISAYQPS